MGKKKIPNLYDRFMYKLHQSTKQLKRIIQGKISQLDAVLAALRLMQLLNALARKKKIKETQEMKFKTFKQGEMICLGEAVHVQGMFGAAALSSGVWVNSHWGCAWEFPT